MAEETGQTRRWVLNASGTALLAGTVAPAAFAQNSSAPPASQAQPAAAPAVPAAATAASGSRDAVSADTAKLADYIVGTLDRPLPADVVTRAKLHILDTFGAMVSGSRLKPGQLAARYVESLGGKPEATVVGSKFLTCSVHAALANSMMVQADETDDTNPAGPVHPGCMSVPAALAISETAKRSGADFLRAVTLGYDIGARIVQALGANELSKRFDPSCVATSFVSAAVSAALLRLNQRQVRHTISYAAQQASGMAIWRRDPDHIEKAFDFGGAGSRDGVMAATMVAFGFTGVEDPFSGDPSIFSALAEKPAPEKLLADLGTKYSYFDTTIKKWSVGSPMQSVVNCMDELLKDPDVTAANVAHITIDMPAYTLQIVDNATSPDLSAQHLVAMMLVDHGLTFASIHDENRMKDPKVLALRPLIELRGSDELNAAKPARQAIMTIDLKNGRSVNYHTVYVRGLSQNPMTKEEVEAKAVDLMNPVLGKGRTKDLIAAVNRIDTFGPISGLRPLLQA